MNSRVAMFCVLISTLALAVVPRQAMALSEEKEIKMGQQEHQKILAQFGLYRDKNLQEYVTKVGQRVADQSSRPDLAYHFTVLNDEMVNAFALPGGYIYVTRGMLAHMNTESELAAVLGHEIAHVTQKHAIKRLNRQKGLDFASQLLAVGTLTPGAYELGSLFGGVLLTGYSREFELEADRVGSEYMAKAGYNPEAMLGTIAILKAKDRVEIAEARLEDRKPAVYHGFLASHPDNDTRYAQAIRESSKLGQKYEEFIKTDEFLEKLNGLAYGPAKKVGVVRKNKFYHPKLGIKLSFPKGWRTAPSRRGIQFVSRTADAAFLVSTERLSKGATPEKFAAEKFADKVREGRSITIGGYPAYLGIASRGESPFGPRPVRFAIIFDTRKRLAFVLQGAGEHDLSKISNDKDFIKTIFSFGRMTREDFAVAKVPALQVVRAEEGTTMEQLAEQSPITNYALDKLRVMNGLYPDGEPEPGKLIKIIN